MDTIAHPRRRRRSAARSRRPPRPERGDDGVRGRSADPPAGRHRRRRPRAAADARRRGLARRRGRRQPGRPRSTPAAAGSSSPRPAGPRTGRPSTRSLREHGAAAVAASNFSLGVALFGRLVEAAVGALRAARGFDPYLLEWHRRAKRDRPSGHRAPTSPRRIVAGHPRLADRTTSRSCRSGPGASPGMHLVGFDAAGETVELRLTARDRSAYAAGILAAADWLARARRASPASTPSTPSSTSSSLAAPSLPERTDR